MKGALLLTAVLWLGLFGTALAAAQDWVRVEETARVAGPDILLGDIAEIHCADAARAQALASLKLGSAAAPGGKRVFSRELFFVRLAAAGESGLATTWAVPPLVTVETRAQRIAGEALVREAEAFLRQELQAAGGEYTVERLYVPDDLTAPEGAVSYKVVLPYGVKYNAPTNATVWTYVDGRLWKKTMLRFRVHVYESVVVTAKSLTAHHLLQEEDLLLQKMDVSELSPGYLTDVARAVGLEIKRTAGKGAVVTRAMVGKPLLIERLAQVYIVSRQNGVEIRTEGQALQDGREGELIRVKNLRSARVVTGRVVDEETVEVSGR